MIQNLSFLEYKISLKNELLIIILPKNINYKFIYESKQTF